VVWGVGVLVLQRDSRSECSSGAHGCMLMVTIDKHINICVRKREKMKEEGINY
jgi:hypothetical protein